MAEISWHFGWRWALLGARQAVPSCVTEPNGVTVLDGAGAGGVIRGHRASPITRLIANNAWSGQDQNVGADWATV